MKLLILLATSTLSYPAGQYDAYGNFVPNFYDDGMQWNGNNYPYGYDNWNGGMNGGRRTPRDPSIENDPVTAAGYLGGKIKNIPQKIANAMRNSDDGIGRAFAGLVRGIWNLPGRIFNAIGTRWSRGDRAAYGEDLAYRS